MAASEEQSSNTDVFVASRYNGNTMLVKETLNSAKSESSTDSSNSLVRTQLQGIKPLRVNGDAFPSNSCEAWIWIMPTRPDCEFGLSQADDLKRYSDLRGVIRGEKTCSRQIAIARPGGLVSWAMAK